MPQKAHFTELDGYIERLINSHGDGDLAVEDFPDSGELYMLNGTEVVKYRWYGNQGEITVYSPNGGTSAQLEVEDDLTIPWVPDNVLFGTESPSSIVFVTPRRSAYVDVVEAVLDVLAKAFPNIA